MVESKCITATAIDEDLAEVVFNEDTYIRGNCPIAMPDRVSKLRIVGNRNDSAVNVKLETVSSTQPCIGHETNDQMSFGRWDISSWDLKELILDNVNIECVGYNDQPFTLGTYGKNNIPQITVLRDSKLDCPETRGTRIVTRQAYPPEGSSKISERMGYTLLLPGQDPRDLLDDERKAIVQEIAKYRPEVVELVDVRHSKNALENLLYCIKHDNTVDLSYWLDKTGNGTYWMTLRTCAVLHMPLDFACNEEFFFECRKVEWFREQFMVPEFKDMKASAGEWVACLMKKLMERRPELQCDYTEDTWDYFYEMIPTYFHTFDSHTKDHAAEVLEFINYPDSEQWEKYVL